MQVALGRKPEEEILPNISQFSKLLEGHTCLLFTNSSVEEILKYFKEHITMDYARAGFVTKETITVEEGELKFPHNMVETLRKLGMPVDLKAGKVTLTSKFTICTVGETLTPEKCRLLKYFEHKLSPFELKPIAYFKEGKMTKC